MSAPPFTSLEEWLQWQVHLHPAEIDLGLERVQAVGERLGVLRPAPLVISVAGTNGKGSTAALIEQTLLSAGHRVAVYSSPHLQHYTERLRLQGRPVDASQFCDAFARVEAARGQTSLSYFEYGTLAALAIIQANAVQVAILEVGLGGRLDAVNAVDADAMLITNIGLDHCDWLGSDREMIAREKAGIMRSDRPVVCNDAQMPAGIREHANTTGARLIALNRDYHYAPQSGCWNWQDGTASFPALPLPLQAGSHQVENAAGALALLKQLPPAYPWCIEDFHFALTHAGLEGRCQWRVWRGFGVLLDVAHNSEAVAALATELQARPHSGRTLALFGALRDKPAEVMLARMRPWVDEWVLVTLPDNPRSLDLEELEQLKRRVRLDAQVAGTVRDGWQHLSSQLRMGDRVVVFGSFHTLTPLIEKLEFEDA